MTDQDTLFLIVKNQLKNRGLVTHTIEVKSGLVWVCDGKAWLEVDAESGVLILELGKAELKNHKWVSARKVDHRYFTTTLTDLMNACHHAWVEYHEILQDKASNQEQDFGTQMDD